MELLIIDNGGYDDLGACEDKWKKGEPNMNEKNEEEINERATAIEKEEIYTVLVNQKEQSPA